MKKTLLALLIAANGFCYSKPVPPSRSHLLIDANWKFNLGDAKDAQNITFNDAAWRNLDLPHDWSIEGEFDQKAPTGGGGGYLPTGIGWYRKTFKLPATAKGKQVAIQFDGVYQNSEVWINGHYLGKRPNGYISFVYDLTPYLKANNNVLAVKVDNSKQPNSRWYSGSGIYRHVWLNITNSIHVAQWGTYITTPQADEKLATVMVKTQVENTGTAINNATVTAEVLDESGKAIASEKAPLSLAANTPGEVPLQISVKSPKLWSVDHPNLYTLHISILNGKNVVDEYNQPFGIRNIKYSSTDGFFT